MIFRTGSAKEDPMGERYVVSFSATGQIHLIRFAPSLLFEYYRLSLVVVA